MGKFLILWLLMLGVAAEICRADEVVPVTPFRTVERIHPKTGKPYVTLTPEPSRPDPLERQHSRYRRPDYRMLKADSFRGEIDYDGPSSDRTKIYVFAGAVATAGTVGGIVLAPAAAASSGGAAGGAGGYLAAGSALSAGSVAAGLKATGYGGEERADFVQESGAWLVPDEPEAAS